MSSEILNKKPLDLFEKKKDIKFVSDELGLGKPTSRIPTDVAYFLDKQQRDSKGTYSYGQALTDAFNIDNLGVSTFKKIYNKNEFDRDLNYEPSQEEFDIIESRPEYLRGVYLDAKSKDHFYFLDKQVQERLDVEDNLNNMGWKGFSARMVAATADLPAIALSIGSGGLIAPAIYGGKMARIYRALKYGALVGVENAVIESGLVAIDPMKNAEDIKYAMYGGFVLGTGFGAASRGIPKDIAKKMNNLDLVAKKAMDDLELEEVNNFASSVGEKPNKEYMNNRKKLQPNIPNKYDFTVTDDAKAASILDTDENSISKYEKLWREGKAKLFGVFPVLRFSMSSSLNKSPDNEIKLLAQLMFPDPIVGAKGATMLEYKDIEFRRVMDPFQKTRDTAFLSFLKQNPSIKKNGTYRANEMFQEIIADAAQFPETSEFLKYLTPEMKSHANHLRSVYKNVLEIAKDSGRDGWSDVGKSPIQNYFPHVHSTSKLIENIDEYGLEQIYKVYANALEKIRPNIKPKTFERMIKGIVKKISNKFDYDGLDVVFARAFQGTDEAGMKEFLEELDLTKEQIDEIMGKMGKRELTPKEKFKEEQKKLDSNAKRRLPFDINIKTDVKSTKTGKVKSISLKNLMDRNAERITVRYANQVIGQAAMARFGGFKNKRDLTNFLNRVRNRNKKPDVKYDDLDDHLAIIDVVTASLLGKRNPLEKSDPKGDKLRRIARLIGDYNFLRLFGQVGFAQGAELYGALGEVGWTTALKAMPQMETIFNNLRAGEVDIKDPLVKELRATGMSMGQDKFMNSPTARLEGQDDMLVDDKATLFNEVEYNSAKAKRVLADASLLNPMTMLSQVWSGKALSVKIVENVKKLAKDLGTTKIYNQLKLGDKVRYRQLGWTETEFNKIAKNINKHSIINEKGFVDSIGLDNWDVDARSSYIVGLNRWIDRVVQRNDLASMHKWFTKDFVKLIVQFRMFSLGAYEKQLLNGLYTLHQTRGQDYETYSRFISSMIGAGTFASAQIYINSFGMRDRDEYLKKRLAPDEIAKISFLRSSWSTLIPGVAESAYYFVSDENLFGYGRNTELSSNLLSGIPSFDLADNIINTSRGLVKSITDPNYKPSQSEMRRMLSIFIAQNALGVKNVNNMIVDYFAK